MQFQTLAGENIERFQEARVQKVIAPCPHCLHTLGREYSTLDETFQVEVVHHSQLIRELARGLTAHPLAHGVRITGPAPAPLERLRGRWRFQLLLRGVSGTRLRKLVRAVVGDQPRPDLTIDVDPYDLM